MIWGFAILLGCLAPVSVSGCGQSAAPSDPLAGREALAATLDAWKAGEKPADLARRDPPIHAADDDWMSGVKLQNYRVLDDGKRIGSDLQFSADLELKNAKGKIRKQRVIYSVTTRPHLLVSRSESL